MQTIPWDKIKVLEEEIKTLKALGENSNGKKKISKKVNKKNNLRGILKGVEFTEKDFEEAKKIWFDYDHLMYQKHKEDFISAHKGKK